MYTTLTILQLQSEQQGDTEVYVYAVRHYFISCEGLPMQMVERRESITTSCQSVRGFEREK